VTLHYSVYGVYCWGDRIKDMICPCRYTCCIQRKR